MIRDFVGEGINRGLAVTHWGNKDVPNWKDFSEIWSLPASIVQIKHDRLIASLVCAGVKTGVGGKGILLGSPQKRGLTPIGNKLSVRTIGRTSLGYLHS